MSLAKRQGLPISSNCFAVCNNGFLLFQSIGLQYSLCEREALLGQYFPTCNECVSFLLDQPIEGINYREVIGPFYDNFMEYCSPSFNGAIPTATSNGVTLFTVCPSCVTGDTPMTTLTPGTATISGATSSSGVQYLTSRVPRPSRVRNATYNPSTSAPSNYIYGCPPGTICVPVKVDCNFEYVFATPYLCPPNQCQPAGSLPTGLGDPSQLQWNRSDLVIKALALAGNYIHLDPGAFGLGFTVFDASSTSGTSSGMMATSSSLASAAPSTEGSASSSSPTNTSNPAKYWIAGAVLGSVVFIVAFIIVGILLMRQRRKQRRAQEADALATEKPQLDAEGTEVPRKELYGQTIKEMPTEAQRQELLTKYNTAELGPPMEPVEMDAGEE